MAGTDISLDKNFYRLMTGAEHAFLKVKDLTSFSNAIDKVLSELGTLFGVDRSYLFRYSKDLSFCSNTHEWCAEGIYPQKDLLQQQPSVQSPWWTFYMTEMRPLHIADVQALPEEAASERTRLKELGIRSLLVVPFGDDHSNLLGFIGFDAVRAPHRWREEHIDKLRLLAEVISNTIVRMETMSELKQLENELREERNWFEHVLRLTKTGFDVIDTDFNLQFVDTVWQEVYGDPAGRKCYEYFHGRDRPCPTCGIPRALETKKTTVTKEVMPRENDRIVEVHTIPFQDKSGRWMVVEFNLDITERERTEAALANAQKLESLGVLAGGIAHDFNNLMGGIFGYIEIASCASTEKMVKQNLARALDAIGRARDLTRQLLTFAKGGSPVREVSPLFPFIEQTVQFAMSGSNVECRFDIRDGLWPVSFDKNQIGQAVDNIIINAQQAMPLGGVVVVSARNVALAENEHPVLAKRNYVRLSITDTGVGIPREILKRIFDPFFTTKSTGHGLGLATAYSIVKRHGGCIDVHSEPGKGSTFNLYLPAVKEQVPGSNGIRVKEHRGDGMFLVMDDEGVIRDTVSSMLKSFGYTAVTRVNGQEALTYVASAIKENLPLSGMLLDLTVPGAMGGEETIEHIRKMGVRVPAFVASGYADDPIMNDPARYGFTASICKPFMRSELAEMLEKHMEKK